jgi:DNA transposition AAA+ family ATPase
MNLNPGKTDFTEAEHDALRADIKAQKDSGVSQAEIARQSEVAEATLSQYLSGTYTSEPGRTNAAAKLTKWLRSLEVAAEMRRQLPTPPHYLPLHGSKSITSILSYARETGRLVMVAGSPGVSKTATARQFREDMPRTYYAAMDATTSGVPTMLMEVLLAMGITETKGLPQLLMRQVCQRVSDAKSLIIIDEAQHLSDKAIEALRAINDKVRVGIAIMGNEAAWTQVGATGGKAAFAQVSSRFAHRSWILAPDERDAATLARAWAETNGEVITDRDVKFCQSIAAKAGGLRNIEMTFEKALLMARGLQTALGIEHLQAAFAQLSGVPQGR